jgi:heme/copper-type cytochrome/quinol oxidase subunit 2
LIATFWLLASIFLVVQAGTLVFLLSPLGGREGEAEEVANRNVEIVWTLVPAAVVVALVLMMHGLAARPWPQGRMLEPESGPQTVARGAAWLP